MTRSEYIQAINQLLNGNHETRRTANQALYWAAVYCHTNSLQLSTEADLVLTELELR